MKDEVKAKPPFLSSFRLPPSSFAFSGADRIVRDVRCCGLERVEQAAIGHDGVAACRLFSGSE
jgi:hypothetical protein